jgi:glycosyltransferase involved in cell wall biosynthesis
VRATAPLPQREPRARSGTCLVTVCTLNHLHFARALVESWRRFHPDAPAFVAIADYDGVEPIALEGATALSGAAVAGPFLPFMALKYSATDLCCALKPYAVQHLIETTQFERIVYLDSDIYLFAALDALLQRLDSGSIVVTPHTRAPLPHPERFWERPSLGDLAYAGVFNAGMFGLRVDARAEGFVATWREMVTRPGAFVGDLGGQMEQNSFNWVICFTDGVEVLRDPAYNVAYWNLHDRSVRATALDADGGEQSWTVDGEPLVAFHFSGFSPATPSRLSRYDARHSLYILPSLARLMEHYGQRLLDLGAEETRALPYRYDRFTSGIRLDHRMRRVFREHETFLWADVDPWTPAGEAVYCRALLSPIPYWSGLVPALVEQIRRERPDLQASYPDAHQCPEGLLRWAAACGVYECGYEELWNRFRPVKPNRHGVVLLQEALERAPELFAGLDQPLGPDRDRFLRRLDGADWRPLAEAVSHGDAEHYDVSTIRRIRSIVNERPDVRHAFPNLLTTQAGEFADWLRGHGHHDHCLPVEAADLFVAKANGRSLARIYSYVSRTWPLMESWPLAFAGPGSRELATHLMAVLRHGLEFDLEDILMYLWTTADEPWVGVGLTLQLPVNARQGAVLPEDQERVLAPLLARDSRFRQELERYRAAHDGPSDRLLELCAKAHPPPAELPKVSIFDTMDRGALARIDPKGRKGRSEPEIAGATDESSKELPQPPPLVPGVNLFGYHKSPIGLGSLTRGLDSAFRSAGIATGRVVVGNIAMDADLSPADFIRTWDPTLDTNVLVSYPHLHDMLLEGLPAYVTAGRRNVVYLAWEQRDGSHHWPEVYAGFEQIWALSQFAADSLARFARREVHAVPCVLDFAALPAAAAKSEVGVPPDAFTFLYVFDANSSIERKNPEAAIRAFSRAFSPGEPVQLVLRASNAHRLEHRERIKQMLRAVTPGQRVQVRLEPMRHHELLRLVSAVDCYMSLHRAEGFGYTCAEAMAYGVPVIATGYSGNLQFMNRDNSFLVDWTERAVEVPDGPFQRGSIWAEPSVDHAAELMRHVYERTAEAREVGARAARDVRVSLSAETVGRRVAALLGSGHSRAVPEESSAAVASPA